MGEIVFYVTGDIHGDVYRARNLISEYGMGPEDTLILLGDVGLNYFGDGNEDYSRKQILNAAGVEVLCIHGNHERRPASLQQYHCTKWRGGEVFVEEEFPNLLFAQDGEIYNLDGVSALVCGGAYSVDKFFRLDCGYLWFSDEQPSDEIKRQVEKRLDSVEWKVDVVLTHTCPAKYTPVEAFLPGLDQRTVDRSTEEWLDAIEEFTEYKKWYCGHWHIDKVIDKIHFLKNDVCVIGVGGQE